MYLTRCLIVIRETMITITSGLRSRTLNWPAARTGLLAFAPKVFLALGPLKVLGRAQTADAASVEAIATVHFGNTKQFCTQRRK
jgi:hypothetical protein